MGRADGNGRLVSLPGDDDEGTGILHVDMDAFYAGNDRRYLMAVNKPRSVVTIRDSFAVVAISE